MPSQLSHDSKSQVGGWSYPPSAGIAVALALVFVSVLIARQSRGQVAESPSADSRQSDEWSDANKAIDHGILEIKITEAQVAEPKVIGNVTAAMDRGDGVLVKVETTTRLATDGAKLLIIKLTVTNKSASRIVRYEGWGLDQQLFVKDDAGNLYRHIGFRPGWVDGQTVNQQSIYPGKSVNDVLVFERPVDSCKYLLLELPASSADGQGALKIKIPRTMLAAPEELRKAAASRVKKETAERQVAEARREDEAKWRKWTIADDGGPREAKFLKSINGVVYLENRDGTTIQVPKDKFSADDWKWIASRGWTKR